MLIYIVQWQGRQLLPCTEMENISPLLSHHNSSSFFPFFTLTSVHISCLYVAHFLSIFLAQHQGFLPQHSLIMRSVGEQQQDKSKDSTEQARMKTNCVIDGVRCIRYNMKHEELGCQVACRVQQTLSRLKLQNDLFGSFPNGCIWNGGYQLNWHQAWVSVISLAYSYENKIKGLLLNTDFGFIALIDQETECTR